MAQMKHFQVEKWKKLPTVGGGIPPPTPYPHRSLLSQTPSQFEFSIVFLSRNFLLKYAQDCTFSSRKMKKLPTIWEGGHSPSHTPIPSVASLPRNLNSPIVFLSRNFLKYTRDCTFQVEKWKISLPYVGGGIPPPTPYTHQSLLSLTIWILQ